MVLESGELLGAIVQGAMTVEESQRDVPLLPLKTEEGDPEPKNVVNLRKVEKTEKQILALEPPKRQAVLTTP